jgi:peptidoglycan hydrolase CwlO-like protein
MVLCRRVSNICGGGRLELQESEDLNMTIEVALLLSVISVSFSIFFGIKNSKKSDEKDIAEKIARDTRTDMKLDEISKDVKEVKETVRNIQNDVKDHEGRITKLEASLKAVHKRLDVIFELVGMKKDVGNDERQGL